MAIEGEMPGSAPPTMPQATPRNAAAATVIDGFEMNRRGRGGEALGISLMSGLVGGLFGLLVLALATVGTDPVSGVARFTFGSPDLLNGIRPIIVMVGLFAVTELIVQVTEPDWEKPSGRAARLRLPGWAMWKRLARPNGIGAVIGAVEGATPGAAGSVAAFLAYNEARRWSKHPEEFGKGSPEGVAAPECANNVVTGTALVPLLGLGIPGSNSAAVLMGGLLLHGLTPGPMLFARNPDVVYGLYAGLLVANIAMVLVGLVILTPCLWLVTRPKHYLMAFILALVVTGVYAIEQSLFDVGVALGVGVVGYGLRACGVPQLPMVLGAVLGFMIESNYRRSLVLSAGDHRIFLQDPVSLALLILAGVLVAYSFAKRND